MPAAGAVRGHRAKEVFKNAGIRVKPVTLQPDVKSVLTQVELGNVDAGMVYVTDVKAAGSKVKGVPIPADDNASTTYPIATIAKGATTRPSRTSSSPSDVPAGREGARPGRVREALTQPVRLTGARRGASAPARAAAARSGSAPAPLLVPALSRSRSWSCRWPAC